jgi:hypothetical protein
MWTWIAIAVAALAVVTLVVAYLDRRERRR